MYIYVCTYIKLYNKKNNRCFLNNGLLFLNYRNKTKKEVLNACKLIIEK